MWSRNERFGLKIELGGEGYRGVWSLTAGWIFQICGGKGVFCSLMEHLMIFPLSRGPNIWFVTVGRVWGN